jgi:hypothetical protein
LEAGSCRRRSPGKLSPETIPAEDFLATRINGLPEIEGGQRMRILQDFAAMDQKLVLDWE